MNERMNGWARFGRLGTYHDGRQGRGTTGDDAQRTTGNDGRHPIMARRRVSRLTPHAADPTVRRWGVGGA